MYIMTGNVDTDNKQISLTRAYVARTSDPISTD